jgi:hypothetical protein
MTDELYIVRAVSKISSALTNLDNITESVGNNLYFKTKFHRDLQKYCDFFCHHTYEMTSEMAKSNWAAYYATVYEHMSEVDLCVEADSEELKQIGLLVMKIHSAISDLKKVDKSILQNKLFVEPLIGRAQPIFGQGYIKRLPVDKEGWKRISTLTTEIGEEVLTQ